MSTEHPPAPIPITAAALRARAERFARSLDADRFEAVRRLLAPDCAYESRRGTLVGPDAILASYREASESAREMLDGIAYESVVLESDERSAVVEFVDLLTHAGRRHEYRCRQRLEFGPSGEIRRIVHEEIPGQREGVEEFFRASGVNRSGPPPLV